ncbi:DUF1413 domain-containing protein [Lactococcus lactis]|uniref:DUF1413 domain-containing protein n=1 Tax=Lactococcus lactis TaxID=1358 RepID=UPI00285B0A51|nr:DUF1413 domain-containing protein [Lactococcus lactis]MDR7697315.1 DUF1413 domain-containing protein [Lactococcus lactis]
MKKFTNEFKSAQKSLNQKNLGDKFLLKDLFTKAEWNEIPKTSFGRSFKEAVMNNNGQINGIEHFLKKSDNNNVYKKL